MKKDTFGAFVDCDILPCISLVTFRHIFITNGDIQSVEIRLYNVPAHLMEKAKKRIESSRYKIGSIMYGQVYENIYSK